MLDLWELEQFVRFYHTGTLAEAAEQLHISQPTLTRSMKKIEAEFGVPLFSRTKNRITLTESGALAAQEAELVLRQTEGMLRRVREFDRANRTITIGVCTPVLLPDLIRKLSFAHPEATIATEVKKLPLLLEGLKAGTYQLVLFPARPDDPALFSQEFARENLLFCLPKKHRFARRQSLSLADMNGENMLLFQDIGFWHDLVSEKMPDSRFLLQTERYSFLELVENSVLPSFATDLVGQSPPPKDRVTIPITDPEVQITYYLVCKKEQKKMFGALFQHT